MLKVSFTHPMIQISDIRLFKIMFRTGKKIKQSFRQIIFHKIINNVLRTLYYNINRFGSFSSSLENMPSFKKNSSLQHKNTKRGIFPYKEPTILM